MSEDQTKNELSLGYILNILYKRKIVLVATTFIVLILSTLLFQLYDRGNVYYNAEYTYQFPGIENEMYPNNTSFLAQKVTSLEVLEEVKNTDKKYEKIDVQSISKSKKNISLSRYIQKNQITERIEYGFHLKISKKYFKNKKLAEDFMKDLILVSYNEAWESIDSIPLDNMYLDRFISVDSYDEQLKYLFEQRNRIITNYSELIEKFGDKNLNGKKISDYRETVKLCLTDLLYDLLLQELNQNKYIKNIDVLMNNYKAQKSSLKKEQQLNEKKINLLNDEIEKIQNPTGSISFDSFYKEIALLTMRNVEIADQITKLQIKIDLKDGEQPGKEIFEKSINNIYEEVNVLSNLLNKNIKEVYKIETNLIYIVENNESKIITETGGIGLIISIIVSGIFGFAIACGVVYILEKKEKNTIV